MLYCAALCCIALDMLHRAALCCIMLYCVVPCRTCRVVLHCAVSSCRSSRACGQRCHKSRCCRARWIQRHCPMTRIRRTASLPRRCSNEKKLVSLVKTGRTSQTSQISQTRHDSDQSKPVEVEEVVVGPFELVKMLKHKPMCLTCQMPCCVRAIVHRP